MKYKTVHVKDKETGEIFDTGFCKPEQLIGYVDHRIFWICKKKLIKLSHEDIEKLSWCLEYTDGRGAVKQRSSIIPSRYTWDTRIHKVKDNKIFRRKKEHIMVDVIFNNELVLSEIAEAENEDDIPNACKHAIKQAKKIMFI